MLTYFGQIESVIVADSRVGGNYQLVVRREGYADTLEVKVELVDATLLEKFSELERLQKELFHRIHTVLGIKCKVTICAPKTLTRFEGKAKRILDLRNEDN